MINLKRKFVGLMCERDKIMKKVLKMVEDMNEKVKWYV